MEKEPLLPISVDLVKEKEGYMARKTSQSIFLPVCKRKCRRARRFSRGSD
jgi:hypothetical protein